MLYLIYLVCSVPLIWYLENRPDNSCTKKAIDSLNLIEKIFFYSIPLLKELYTLINIIENKKPEWFDGI